MVNLCVLNLVFIEILNIACVIVLSSYKDSLISFFTPILLNMVEIINFIINFLIYPYINAINIQRYKIISVITKRII